MADNTWHRTLCGIGVSEWDGKGGDPAPRDCGACADAPQPAPPAQPDPAALRALRALLRLPGLLRGQPVASDRRGERTMTTQTHVCSVAGCPQPVTLMTSLNGNPLRAYCATHAPVVYTQPAPPAQPDAAALLRDVLSEHWLAGIDCDETTHMDRPRCACSLVAFGWSTSVGGAVEEWADHVAQHWLAARAAAGGGK